MMLWNISTSTIRCLLRQTTSKPSFFRRYSTFYHHRRRLSTVTVPESKAVFNRRVHRLNKTNAAQRSNSEEYDYFRREIATRLISRILDLDGSYPVALDFGSHSGSIYKEMINFIRSNPSDKVPGGIQQLFQIDDCSAMLHRDEIPEWQQQLIQTERIETEQIETKLPFDDDQFDVVVSSMSLQWLNDIPSAMTEIHRVLKPDGCFLGAFSGGGSLQELRSSLLLADQERRGGMNSHLSPAINVSDVGSLLSRCGFVMVTVDNEVIEMPYPNLFVLCHHLHGMGDQHAPNIEGNAKRYTGIGRDVFLAAAAIHDAMYSDSESISKDTRDELHRYQSEHDGLSEAEHEVAIDCTMQIIYFMAWTPAPTQRKPMERGTAQYSMKDLEEITEIIAAKEEEAKKGDGDDDKDGDDGSSK